MTPDFFEILIPSTSDTFSRPSVISELILWLRSFRIYFFANLTKHVSFLPDKRFLKPPLAESREEEPRIWGDGTERLEIQ